MDRDENVPLRRWLFAGLVVAFCAALLGLAAWVLGAGGWSGWEVAIMLALVGTAPWSALVAANAVVGFIILMGARDPVAAVLPALRRADAERAPTRVTALVLCIRNEDVQAVLAGVAPLLAGLEAKGLEAWFRLHILSDTGAAEAAAEAAAIAAFVAGRGREAIAVHYRRRAINTGYKAGNVMDFCDHHAGDAAYFIGLDADSSMSPAAVLRLVACMEADPRLAILQQMIVGRPARAAFPRLFQFGMRAGMRAWGTGQAWWQGDEGPYWGHNAIIRVAPFREHCRLGTLPDGRHILSHDQVEAVRLHGAGWKVRVLTAEDGSAEGTPPAMTDFCVRDLRWAAGNMQYWALLRLPEMTAMGRWQLAQAILLFFGAPLWLLLFLCAVANAVSGGGAGTPALGLIALVILGWWCFYAAKLLGYLEVMLKPGLAAAYGGRRVFAQGAAAELVFTALFEPARVVHQAAFLAGMLFGRRVGWEGQNRGERRVRWRDALRMFRVEMALGGVVLAVLGGGGVSWLAWVLTAPVLVSLVGAPALAVWTTDERVSSWLVARGIAAVPEERGGGPQ